MKANLARMTMMSALLGAATLLPRPANAHCDTLDGPVVAAAKAALEKKDITPVLKWVKQDVEAEIEAAFARTLAVRTQGPEARSLADQFFFETLVRLHRAGEGAPFTGLKPAGTELGPAVESADKALENGDLEPVVNLITGEAARGIRKRFVEAREKQAHAEHNVEAGRAFVAAYVEYVHYVEGLHEAARGVAAPHAGAHEAAPSTDPRHESPVSAHAHGEQR